MPWPIPEFEPVKYPKRISWRFWLPTLAVIAAGAAGAVLMLWSRGKPTNTVQFWAVLVGAPLVACALAFGPRLNRWEKDQTEAEERERDQQRVKGLWRDWTRRHLRIADVVAFPAATDRIEKFAEVKIDLPTNKGRPVEFEWANDRTAAFRRTRLLRLVARRFAETLRGRREVVVTLMLDKTSLDQSATWSQQAKHTLRRLVPGVIFHVEARLATDAVPWITERVDHVDPTVRLVIAAQLWPDDEAVHAFSEGAAAFLIDPAASQAGSIFRPMEEVRSTLDIGLGQITQIQMPPGRVTPMWFTGGEDEESTPVRSALTADPKESAAGCLLDSYLGMPGPAGGWIALAIAMDAIRGAGPQLVAWREPGPEADPLYLCTVSPVPQPMPQEETTV